jgi:hypothetical protein
MNISQIEEKLKQTIADFTPQNFLSNFLMAYGNARFIDVQTGKILKSDGVDGETSNFFKLQKQLTWKIVKNLDTKVSDEEKNFITKQGKQNKLTFEDSKLYSAALDYYDKKNNSKAIELLDKINKKYPEFQAAKIARSKIK